MSTKRVQIIGGFPQADWNQTDETKSDFIKNKPSSIGEVVTDDEVLEVLATQNIITPVVDATGAIYTDEKQNILTI